MWHKCSPKKSYKKGLYSFGLHPIPDLIKFFKIYAANACISWISFQTQMHYAISSHVWKPSVWKAKESCTHDGSYLGYQRVYYVLNNYLKVEHMTNQLIYGPQTTNPQLIHLQPVRKKKINSIIHHPPGKG